MSSDSENASDTSPGNGITTVFRHYGPPTAFGILKSVPPELRLIIYGWYFHGSKVTMGFRKTGFGTASNVYAPNRRSARRAAAESGDVSQALLYTNGTIYREAVPSFWSEAIVSSHVHIPARYNHPRYEGHEPIPFEVFMRGLSDTVKRNMTHLRKVRLPRMGAGHGGAGDSQVPALLAQFPKLKTVVLAGAEDDYWSASNKFVHIAHMSEQAEAEVVSRLESGLDATLDFQIIRSDSNE